MTLTSFSLRSDICRRTGNLYLLPYISNLSRRAFVHSLLWIFIQHKDFDSKSWVRSGAPLDIAFYFGRIGAICETITKADGDKAKKRDRTNLTFLDPYDRRFLEQILKKADERITTVMKSE
jgi:hypothetical protein